MPNQQATRAVVPANAEPGEESAESTRRRVLGLVASDGPVTAADLAARLGLTSAGVRRHLAQLEEDGTITVHSTPGVAPVRRGRPARAYVVTSGGQGELHDAYSEVAVQALRHLRAAGGESAVVGFAAQRYDDVVERLMPQLTATDPAERAAQLAAALSHEGYAASVRPVAAATLVPIAQLCQGHCPVQHVAEEFPELCEAEARAFAELLGTHVQRLATIAGGAHACVTNLPLGIAQAPTAAQIPEGTR
ncbi:putative transcriptional regulator [Xylanimonas cellulosilytica DSM 15894]|uniref:Transcriptional regulator n=1 Tax=Xylanimonas cellulosilytica (strain DSM 15894 / JCM 12276 / CECT 5975 / KCTC 9989 / LMG 20990 / NBRC 107835 / XIL07) TaxID=446471 RepID=D1BRD2_XYLCX|nr:helix-turn-helix domain-containing protein [Xylanimonas cellulosilytica]ACZ30387.1 putative transcriptional regulator [Xylanimonas cellulosilytica DSM 15894]